MVARSRQGRSAFGCPVRGLPGGRRRPGRRGADQARLADRARERELRHHVRGEHPGALPCQDAAGQRGAGLAVLRDRPREPRQLHRADQRAGAEPEHAGGLPGLHRPAARHDRQRRAGARHRLRLPDARCRRSPGSFRPRAWAGRATCRTWATTPTREAATCGHPAVGSADGTQKATAKDNYAARHDPFVYFHSIIDSPVCNQRVVPLTALPHDLASEADTPAFSFITPSLCEDGHDAPCADGRPGGLVSRRRVPARVDAAHHLLPGLQRRRPRDRHLRRGRDERRRRLLRRGTGPQLAAARDLRRGRWPHRRGDALALHPAGHDLHAPVQPLLAAAQRRGHVRPGPSGHGGGVGPGRVRRRRVHAARRPARGSSAAAPGPHRARRRRDAARTPRRRSAAAPPRFRARARAATAAAPCWRPRR